MKILFIAATQTEINCIKPSSCLNDSLIFYKNEHHCIFNYKIIGIGQSAIEKNLSSLLSAFSPDIVLLFGSAGGLVPNIPSGAIFFPSSVLRIHNDTIEKFDLPMDDSFFSSSCTKEAVSGQVFQGGLVTSSHFVNFPEEKSFLWKNFHVSAVDMETFFAVRVCSEKSIPVIVMRVIIDDLSIGKLTTSAYLNKEEKIFANKNQIIKKNINKILDCLFS